MFITPITQGIFSRVDYKLGHKTTLSKFSKVKITSNTFYHHNDMKLEIKHKKKKTNLASSTMSSVTGEWSESPGQWLEVTRVSFSCWMELVSLVPSQSKQASPRSTWNFEGWVMVIYIRNRSWSLCLCLLQDLKRIAIWLMIIVLLLTSFSNPLGLDLETVWPPLDLRLWK